MKKGISSVYGFILIFLLSMASIQTWSSAVGAMENIQGASDQGHQMQQLQSIEHLSLSVEASNLTIVNNGQVASTVEYLRLLHPNSSRTLQLDVSIAVGGSVEEQVPSGYDVEAVTSLGNVFSVRPGSDPPGSIWSSPAGAGGSGNEELFQNPYDPSLFYLSSGPRVYAFFTSGTLVWSFDAGAGTVTDVMPISGGQVYVSVGYASPSNAGQLYELGPNGQAIAAFSVRVLDSPGAVPSSASQPVAKGEDLGYALYDGWFYSVDGPSASLSLEDNLLAATDASSFYEYVPLGGTSYGICQPWGNQMLVDSFSPGSGYPGGLRQNWTAFVYLGPCTRYDPQLQAAATGGGVLATLFAAPYYSNSYLQALPGYNPYIAIISASGQVLYNEEAPSNGYTSVATDGSTVYMSLPSLDDVQVLSLASQTISTYNVGIAASSLLCGYGFVFAISQSEVKVYAGSMNLVKTINLAPLTLSSFSNALSSEPALKVPSFLVLNSTSYAAFEDNATGYSNLVIGNYG